MKKFYVMILALVAGTVISSAQQLPNPGFEDWSGAEFDGNIQPKTWNYSNVTQFGFKFNFAHRESGHSGSYCAMVQDQEVGAAGITETSPGYFSLGQPWVYIKSLTAVNQATAGDKGSISWKYRPDTMQVWIKRTGDNVLKEDFHLLFYSWSGTAKGSKYKGKNESCTSVGESYVDEESDVRQALDGNECGTDVKANQVAEGWWRERKEYGSWTCINVPIYYFNDEVPDKCNVIFSASNYPNFRANSGLFAGNSLYVDDVKMIYSSQIQSLYVGGKKWNGFVPTSTEEQEYSLGQNATEIPEIYAMRGQGSLVNARGTTATFPGRKLTSSECVIKYGTIDGEPTTITVKAEDGSSTTVYKIKFVRAASTNSRLGGIQVNGVDMAGFNAYKFDYNYELPYGTTAAPVLSVTQAEDAQNVTITQATSTTGTATVKVVAADKKTTSTYTIKFSVAKLSDNTLKDITVGGESLKGFLPTKNLYTVELPLGTTAVPDIKAISAYKAGEQTIEYNNQGLDKPFEIKVTAPGNANSRTYKLNFKITASSYVYLQDLQVAGYDIGFEQGKKVYYISLPIGTATIPEVTYVAGDKYQTINKVTEVDTDNPDRTWVKLTVTAGNGDQLIYKIAFDLMRSSVTTLNGIALDGKALANFSSTTYKYDVELPIGTTKIPTVTYTKGDELQKVAVVTSEIDPTDNTATSRLTVTADNGDQAVYVINFTIAQANNTTLNMIYVNGVAIPNFDPNVRNYDYVLPLGTKTWPTVTWDAHDEWQTVATRQGTFNASKTNVMKVNVTSGAGTAGTYELSFTVAAASKNTALKSIAVNGTNIPDFSATTYSYNYKLPIGTTAIPVVSAEKAEDAQTLTITQAKSVTGTATIKVVAEDKSVYKNYTVNFSVEASSNVALKSISVGGVKIAGFDPEVLEYNIELPAGTKVLPDITCETDGYQTISVRNELVNLTGDYKIVVTAPSGATRTYVLHISVVTSSNADLNMIYSGGTRLADFDKNKTSYVVGLPVGTTTVPALTYDKGDEGQTVNVIDGGLDGTTEIVVRAADGKTTKTYTITYVIEKATNTTLTAIKVGGVLIAGFDPEVTNYTYDLSSKTTVLPTVTYTAHDAYQTIVAQTDYMTGLEGDYKIIVRAQSGDTRTYTITFRIVISNNSQLNGITIGGTALEGFAPATKEYNIELPIGTSVLPAIAYTAGDEAQTITVNKGDVNGKTTIVVRAEDGTSSTYTLNFTVLKANDTTLKSILIDGVEISGFRADSTEYRVDLKSTTTVLPAVTYVQHDEWQTVTVRTDEMDGLTGTYKIVVRAQTGETRVYSIVFSIVISSNAALNEIFIGGEQFLEYTKDVLDYTYYLPLGTTQAPEITYTAGDEFQVITENFRGLNGRNEIIVVAQDGTKRTYSITFVVAKSNKTNLAMITVDGKELADFSFEESDYVVTLTDAKDHGRTDVPVIGFTKVEDAQQVSVVYGSINGTSKIVVVAENGTDSRTYTVRFQLPVSSNCTLNNITLSAGAWSGFSADKTSYDIALPIGTTELPEINAVKGDEWQNVIISRGTSESATSIMVVAENGDRKEYTLNFSVVKSAEAQLAMITIGDKDIPTFLPSTYSYVFQLEEGTMECPEIKVTKKDESQQVTIVRPATTGLASVICIAENGTQSTYTVDVRAFDTRSNNCQLASLKVDGTTLTGFDPLAMKYAYELPAGSTELPEISWTLGESHQSVAVTKGTVKDTTYIRVLAENKIDFNIYKIAFSVAPYSNAQLKELWVGSENILTDADEYTVLLAKDAKTCPEIRPVGQDLTQAIVMTTPVLTGDAVIKVVSAAGGEKIYTIHFVSTLSNDVTLKSITLDGVEVANFDADVTDYAIDLPSGTTALPIIACEKQNDAQQVDIFTGGLDGTTTIRVKAEN
ncbi:MAG: hypothetical protein J5612_03230, partial [Paludibacteraceae bacterium]|nr:hypothetical protein [Paludibacteraceae bacterium]